MPDPKLPSASPVQIGAYLVTVGVTLVLVGSIAFPHRVPRWVDHLVLGTGLLAKLVFLPRTGIRFIAVLVGGSLVFLAGLLQLLGMVQIDESVAGLVTLAAIPLLWLNPPKGAGPSSGGAA